MPTPWIPIATALIAVASAEILRKREALQSRTGRVEVAGLYGMVGTSANDALDHLTLGQILLDAGVQVLQLRMKDASAEQHLEILPALQQLCAETGARLVVNDRLDVAVQVSGVGVHLGQDDTDPREARRALGEEVLIGLSTHSPAQARAACRMPIDYIGYGPIFSAAGKHHSALDRRFPHAPVGLASLKQVVTEATVPVVAIGGVDLERLPLLLGTGVHAVATIAAVTGALSCSQAATAFQRGFASITPSA